MTKIRFLTLTPQQFADGPGRSLLFSETEAFYILMNISSKQASNDMPEGFSTNPIARKKPRPTPRPLNLSKFNMPRSLEFASLLTNSWQNYPSLSFPSTSLSHSPFMVGTEADRVDASWMNYHNQGMRLPWAILRSSSI